VSGNVPPDCLEVYRWPEFQAFAARLGIPFDLRTTRLVIELPGEGCLVKVTQEYHGRDTAADVLSDRIDTTCLQNKQYRTSRDKASEAP
jgi:hypothetical protein